MKVRNYENLLIYSKFGRILFVSVFQNFENKEGGNCIILIKIRSTKTECIKKPEIQVILNTFTINNA